MSASLEESRAQLLHSAAQLAQRPGGRSYEPFLRRYYRHVATEDLLARAPEDLLGAALSHRDFAAERDPGTAKVRVFTPTVEEQGWSCGHSVVEVVTDDMPFLVDSVTGELGRQGRGVHLVVHPQVAVRRDGAGRLVELMDHEVAPGTVPGETAGETAGASEVPAPGECPAPTQTPAPTGIPAPVDSGRSGESAESWMHVEIDRQSSPAERESIAEGLRTVLADVRDAVRDWSGMRSVCRTLADELAARPPHGVDEAEVAGARRLLTWLADGHFTFLGYREYSLLHEEGSRDGDVLQPVAQTGRGLLRRHRDRSASFSRLTSQARAKARDNHLLVITKANSRSTVHRSSYLDYIGVKVFDDSGAVTGERRFLGLFTSSAYTESVLRVPIIDDKVAAVLARAGFTADSHSGKDLLEVLETYPRDELFQIGADELYETATAVLHLQERRKTRLFLRRDEFGRFMSCLVYIPRDRYTTSVRLKMEALLRSAFGSDTVDHTTRVSESVLARLHFVVRAPRGEQISEVDAAVLEQQLVDATRTWDEDLAEVARSEYGEEAGARLVGRYGRGFPEGYKEDFAPRVGVVDLRHVEAVAGEEGDRVIRLNLYHEPGAPERERRFKVYRRGRLTLTSILPLFTDLGVEVVDERPYEIARSDGTHVFVYDFGLRLASVDARSSPAQRRQLWSRQGFQDAFAAVWDGQAESDGFNALVLRAGLTWRQVVILRTVAKYLRQTGSTFSQNYLEDALLSNVAIAGRLVSLFETRFDPDRFAEQGRDGAQTQLVDAVRSALQDVASLDQDRIIRAFLGVIRAALRTNYYQFDDQGRPKSYVSLKLDPTHVPDLPAPRPMFEIWVYSPRVEGVHLRFGRVARGGLRWSDRREDFRTEVLGLAKAQTVKNAVIVPTGSKGGFFAKQLPDPAADREAWLAEGVAAYQLFVSGMLDLTDNRQGGTVTAPDRVVRHDGEDPYLVVAADKGTARFSDIANDVSQSYGFWLDDAFASGGSAGYDHKAMGITARGAWESVQRHFREMGIDTQAHDFTVAGIGDMSGDVFGNGMLLSPHIALVAAFDHRHIFVDPDPDPAASFTERARLFALPRSSWADYDTGLLSKGGGVYARTAKSVPVSAQAAAALGLVGSADSAGPGGDAADASRDSGGSGDSGDSGDSAGDDVLTVTPAALMQAILLAPVDLLWNGGIGTYVKASTQSNVDVGDRANDSIRVNGNQLRCRVVGEGGNLGLSQPGRIEAAFAGVRVNTDAIDNSAGVDTSDHEVNIKILLNVMTRAGDLTLKQRNVLLHAMTDEVAAQVLRDNYEQNILLGNARAQDHSMLPVHRRFMAWLEGRGDFDRALEFLPPDSDLRRRQEAGLGLKSPEFAVLVAYAKLALKQDLLPTGLPDEPWFQATLTAYFPEQIRTAYAAQLSAHPLRREIITNSVVNSMVNRGGITFAFRASEETGATSEQVARAFVVCREIFDLQSYVAAVEALDRTVDTSVQTMLYLEFRRLLDRSVRWFLQNRPPVLDVAGEVRRFSAVVAELAPQVPALLQGGERARLERRAGELHKAGAPADVALRAAGLLDQFSLLDVVEICTDTERDAGEVAPTYFALSDRFGIDAMLTRVTRLPRDDRWDALARAALRDDLYAVLESLTTAVLQSTSASGTPEQRVAEWAQANADSLARATTALSGIERLDNPGISALSVALRTLRGVIKSGSASV